MIVTILGSGTSGGIPMIGCPCPVCRSTDSRDKRLRTSIHISINGKSFVIDAGPDFRQQMLRESISRLDAIIFTHQHRDHTAGLDDIRAYNYFQAKPMDIYLSSEVEASLKKEYHYVFEGGGYPGLPEMRLFRIENRPFYIDEVKITPIEVMHYKLPVFGFRVNNFTYITDANAISEQEIEKIKGSEVLIINALRKERHISHFSLEEALDMIRKINPQKAYLIHMSHQMGLHAEVSMELPENVELAYDGLRIECA